MVEEQNSAVYDHRAISYAPAGFNNYSKAKVQKCNFTIQNAVLQLNDKQDREKANTSGKILYVAGYVLYVVMKVPTTCGFSDSESQGVDYHQRKFNLQRQSRTFVAKVSS